MLDTRQISSPILGERRLDLGQLPRETNRPAASTANHTREVVVAIDHLSKKYGQFQAVSDLSLEIYRGETFGLIGPNGAGKTTTLEITVGLRTLSTGQVRVLGCNPQTERVALARQIGIQPQQASLFPNLKVLETMELFASLHAHPLSIADTLEMVGLTEKAKSPVKGLSGGQRQRLLIAIALIADSQILFLDEPTGSLDPQARRQIWAIIDNFRRQGRTVVLTTHSMEEAEGLCERVGIIDQGQIIALGTPAQLVRQFFPIKTISFDVVEEPSLSRLYRVAGVSKASLNGKRVELVTEDSDRTLQELVTQSGWHNFDIRGGNLEDVFLTLTGRTIRD